MQLYVLHCTEGKSRYLLDDPSISLIFVYKNKNKKQTLAQLAGSLGITSKKVLFFWFE